MATPTDQTCSAEFLQEHVELIWSQIRENSPIYQFALEKIKINSVEKGTVKAGLRVEKKHLNSKGFLHGTVSTCLIDWMGSMVIASHGLEKTGLSTDIHATYIATAQEGDMLLVVGQASRVGRSLAFLTVNISKVLPSGETQIVATGTHTKYIKQ
ncbi:Thioesterase/thiol ester dehydrase-isomerase [Morchella conica CCBAS932]|uniref:Thioesterase/thiol ester dehydrase-isomerase n=1 Tax=Morchella conica CCBAS932 TaxID=1392247 RepID=A0A3N4L9N3_9PEZI|nr:Thioesterase/thiol ester dehydrase-isomerase [Morchella conica CCBAS932]